MTFQPSNMAGSAASRSDEAVRPGIVPAVFLAASGQAFVHGDLGEHRPWRTSRVAVIEGTICRSIAPNVMPNDTVVPGEDTDAMLLLETGRADAAIGHVTVMERCAKTRGGAVFIPEPRVGLVKAFAFRKGNPDVKRIPD